MLLAEHLVSILSHTGSRLMPRLQKQELPADHLQLFRTLQSKSTGFLNSAFLNFSVTNARGLTPHPDGGPPAFIRRLLTAVVAPAGL